MFFQRTEWPQKMAIFWMSAEEHQNQELLDSLRPQFRKWKEQKYQPIVFISGEGDLEENMYCLMKRNYQELAEKWRSQDQTSATSRANRGRKDTYNDTLFEHGLITESERNKMAVAIKERTSKLMKKVNSREVRSGEAGDLKEDLLQGTGLDTKTGANQREIQ